MKIKKPENNLVNEQFEKLLNIVEKTKIDEIKKEDANNVIIKEKQDILLPVVGFLSKVRDAGIMVYPFDYLFKSKTEQSHTEPTQFKFFQRKTVDEQKDGLCYPSPLLVIDDPIKIEISVYNEFNRKKNGLIKISCGKKHPDYALIDGSYETIEEALTALTNFISKNTIKILRA